MPHHRLPTGIGSSLWRSEAEAAAAAARLAELRGQVPAVAELATVNDKMAGILAAMNLGF